MIFSEEKQSELIEKIIPIYLKCLLKYKETKDEKYIDESYFMGEVFNAGLVIEPKQLFLLGALCQKLHDGGPEVLKRTMGFFDKQNND